MAPTVLRCLLLLALLAGVTVNSGAGVLFVPVVAQMEGAEGSYWTTELWVSNLGAGVGTYAITFLPSNSDNSQALLDDGQVISLAAGETVLIKDVVPPRSSGALRVVTSDDVVVKCRLFNAEGRGSVGQSIPALSPDELIPAGSQAHLVPLLRSAQLRTNVGLFNPGPTPLKVQAAVVDPQGERVAVADYRLEPGSQSQINDFLLAFKITRSTGHRVILTGDGAFAAYASLVDARSGASTLVLPVVR